MSGREFELIERCFATRAPTEHPLLSLPLGDDASLHRMEQGMEWVVSTDTSVQGVHWPEDFPLDLASERAVCAALSDLAAMGAWAEAAWVNAVAPDAGALDDMGRGIGQALQREKLALAGGDTVCAPMNMITVTVAGRLPAGTAMRRDRTRPGDCLWLCGRVGFAALGLAHWQAGRREEEHVHAFAHVRPLLWEGAQLRAMGVRACIDVSDGLAADAGHLAAASRCSLRIELSRLPDWSRLRSLAGDVAVDLATGGGEDYALLFAARPELDCSEVGACRIGEVLRDDGRPAVEFLLDGRPINPAARGFDHFGG